MGSSAGILAHGSSPWDSLGMLLFPVAAGWLGAADASVPDAASRPGEGDR